jgi:hypothetical protein
MPYTPTAPGEASYSVLARVLSAVFPDRPRVTNQVIRNWASRGTLNKDGQPFPDPHRVNDAPGRGQGQRFWLTADVIEWARPGVPDLHGKGWRE